MRVFVSDFQRETQNRKSGGWIFNLSTQQQQQQQRPTDCINSRRPLRQSGIHFRLWKLPTNRIQS